MAGGASGRPARRAAWCWHWACSRVLVAPGGSEDPQPRTQGL